MLAQEYTGITAGWRRTPEKDRPSGRSCFKRDCLSSGRARVLRIKIGDLHLLGETNLFHQPDTVVVDVELIPLESMARAHWMCMVVVVPPLAAREQRDPPAV